jgi:putative membrane protein
MFLDYVPLLLTNMAAGLVVLAHFVYAGLDATDRGRWAPAIRTLIACAGYWVHMASFAKWVPATMR